MAPRCAIFFLLPLLQPLLRFLNLLQPILAAPQLFRKLITPLLRSLLFFFGFPDLLRTSQQLRDLRL